MVLVFCFALDQLTHTSGSNSRAAGKAIPRGNSNALKWVSFKQSDFREIPERQRGGCQHEGKVWHGGIKEDWAEGIEREKSAEQGFSGGLKRDREHEKEKRGKPENKKGADPCPGEQHFSKRPA